VFDNPLFCIIGLVSSIVHFIRTGLLGFEEGERNVSENLELALPGGLRKNETQDKTEERAVPQLR